MTDRSVIPGCGVLPRASPRPMRAVPCGSKPRPSKGRWQTLNTFVDASMRHVSGTAAKIWLVIFRDTKPNGLARVSDADLARRTGVSERTVRSARRHLRQLGLLEVIRKGGLGVGASVYRVRALVAEVPCRLLEDDSCHGSRQPASAIPEEDQNGRIDPVGSCAFEKKNAPRSGRKGTP